MTRSTPDLLPGTLDLLILRTLQTDAKHGWAISERIQQISGDVLQINQGSLYPALHRLEHQGWIEAEWAVSELGRRAKYLPADGVRAAAAGRRNPRMGTHVGGNRPRDEAGLRPMSLRDWKLRARALFAPRRVERELDEELSFHLERETQKLVASGMTPGRARCRPCARFGPVAARRRRVSRRARHRLRRQRRSRCSLRAPDVRPRAARLRHRRPDRRARPGTRHRAVHGHERPPVPRRLRADHRRDVRGRAAATAERRAARVHAPAVRRPPPRDQRLHRRLCGTRRHRYPHRWPDDVRHARHWQRLPGAPRQCGVRARPVPADDDPFGAAAGRGAERSRLAALSSRATRTCSAGASSSTAPLHHHRVMPAGFRGLAVGAPDFWAPLSWLGEFRPIHRGREDLVGLDIVGRLKPGIGPGRRRRSLPRGMDSRRRAPQPSAGPRTSWWCRGAARFRSRSKPLPCSRRCFSPSA